MKTKKSLDKVLTEHYKRNKKDVQKILGIPIRKIIEKEFKKAMFSKSPTYKYLKGLKND